MARQELEIVLVSNKREGVETRYDVSNIDFTGAAPKVRSRLGKEFVLSPDEPAEPEPVNNTAPEVWRRFMNELPMDFVEEIGAEALINWAMHQPAMVGGEEYATLSHFLDTRSDNPDDFDGGLPQQEQKEQPFPGEARVVHRASEALIAALGFTPKVAYQIKD